jgi:anti-sigma factor RsiW
LNCDGVIRSVSSYIDGELGVAIRQEFEVHLQGCKDCAIFVHQTKFTIEIFSSAELADLPAETSSRLHEKLRRKISESRK